MSENLKPCPFCGKGEEIKKGYNCGLVINKANDCYQVMCLKCGASTDWFDSESAAKRRWNRRVNDDR